MGTHRSRASIHGSFHIWNISARSERQSSRDRPNVFQVPSFHHQSHPPLHQLATNIEIMAYPTKKQKKAAQASKRKQQTDKFGDRELPKKVIKEIAKADSFTVKDRSENASQNGKRTLRSRNNNTSASLTVTQARLSRALRASRTRQPRNQPIRRTLFRLPCQSSLSCNTRLCKVKQPCAS